MTKRLARTGSGSAAKGVIAAGVLGANTLAMVACMLPAALVKLAVPPARAACDRVLNALARRWIANNELWMRPARAARWEVSGVEALDPAAWYLVASNHQGWVDIFVLQRALRRHAPLLKFFLKRSLVYVPVIGLAWWALDFPFVGRKGGVQGGREDIASTRRSCEKFRRAPTAVLNFLEGTRFTREKARQQKSPYRHLLKPKAAGMATALAVLRDKVDGLLDVTIVYPHGIPTFWGLLCGRLDEVVVRVRRIPFPAALAERASAAAPGFRRQVEAWVQDVWREKDGEIDAILRSRGAAA